LIEKFLSPITAKEPAMSNDQNRVLGRVLAVEETRHVSGAKERPSIGTEPDGGTETSCLNDSTDSTCDQSIPANETTAFEDSGTVVDTGAILDCSISTSKLDIGSGDLDC
jgi:hypothetical protein